jgi:hypothetical protein
MCPIETDQQAHEKTSNLIAAGRLECSLANHRENYAIRLTLATLLYPRLTRPCFRNPIIFQILVFFRKLTDSGPIQHLASGLPRVFSNTLMHAGHAYFGNKKMEVIYDA